MYSQTFWKSSFDCDHTAKKSFSLKTDFKKLKLTDFYSQDEIM